MVAVITCGQYIPAVNGIHWLQFLYYGKPHINLMNNRVQDLESQCCLCSFTLLWSYKTPSLSLVLRVVQGFGTCSIKFT